MKFRLLLAIVRALALAGCITTQEMPLAPNVVRLDTQAGGLLFTGQTVPATMRAAAKATLAAGYTHFRLSDASSGTGSQYIGTTCGGGPNMVTCTNISGPTAAVDVTVTMFHAREPGASGAFDAQQVLAKYGS
jgi:hypothetical protein